MTSLRRAGVGGFLRAIPALARAGAKIVWVGAESGSQKILDAMDKGTKVEEISLVTRIAFIFDFNAFIASETASSSLSDSIDLIKYPISSHCS